MKDEAGKGVTERRNTAWGTSTIALMLVIATTACAAPQASGGMHSSAPVPGSSAASPADASPDTSQSAPARLERGDQATGTLSSADGRITGTVKVTVVFGGDEAAAAVEFSDLKTDLPLLRVAGLHSPADDVACLDRWPHSEAGSISPPEKLDPGLMPVAFLGARVEEIVLFGVEDSEDDTNQCVFPLLARAPLVWTEQLG